MSIMVEYWQIYKKNQLLLLISSKKILINFMTVILFGFYVPV